jgi:hypothetical protein
MKLATALFVGLAFVFLTAAAVFSQEPTYQEVVEKHLESIGAKEARDGMKNLMIVGLSEFESINPSAKGGGRAVFVSEPDNLIVAMSFNSRDYPYEKIGFFNSKVNIPYAIAGKRSLLGAFLMEHSNILTDGLFGGTLSARWPLSLIDSKKSKIRMLGTKKIDGIEAYALEYIPSKGGSDEFSIKLYFDVSNFNHIATEYRREVRAGKITFGQQNQIASSNLVLTEHFSDFRKEEGLNLPHAYRVNFVSNSGNSVFENIWGIKAAQFRFNQTFEPGFFSFDPVSSK